MQTRQPDAHHDRYETLGQEECALHGVSQHPDPPRGVSNESVRTVELRVPKSFSTFESRSFTGLSDVLKKRLDVSLLGSLTTCTF